MVITVSMHIHVTMHCGDPQASAHFTMGDGLSPSQHYNSLGLYEFTVYTSAHMTTCNSFSCLNCTTILQRRSWEVLLILHFSNYSQHFCLLKPTILHKRSWMVSSWLSKAMAAPLEKPIVCFFNCDFCMDCFFIVVVSVFASVNVVSYVNPPSAPVNSHRGM